MNKKYIPAVIIGAVALVWILTKANIKFYPQPVTTSSQTMYTLSASNFKPNENVTQRIIYPSESSFGTGFQVDESGKYETTIQGSVMLILKALAGDPDYLRIEAIGDQGTVVVYTIRYA